MDKLGVEEDQALTKEASGEPKKVCPRCGATLLPVEEVNVLQCPKCGTEPFEQT